MIIDLVNETDLLVDTDLLQKIAQDLTQRQIEFIITDNEGIRALNAQHRQKDTATDVLSFPLGDMPHAPLGAIVISKDFVIQKADELGHSYQEELTLLFIHGLLHLLGFDHERDNGEMRRKEEVIIDAWKLPKSLIVRTEGDKA
ncbi:Metal-dependent hydrolase YbeY, involved in rRNA and/or ribosome maturation and assembly [hydrothermal vent metagenome]|uniref:Metal-dependent hydrolase YbeY, involved in rRNA and/or ribosome maturation and assembly n=1 Tax=hydrothermal vent metagenome TaxID=652676 RepID=A0A1W1E7M5_9ZZZZ